LRLTIVLKAAFTVTALAILLWSVEVRALAGALSLGRPLWLPALAVATVLLLFTDARLHAAVMRREGYALGVGASMLYAVVGWFFSQLTPSVIGVDAFRAVQMRHTGVPTGQAVRFALTARLSAAAGLVVVILAGLPLALGYAADPVLRLSLVATALGATAGGGLLVLYGRLGAGLLPARWPLAEPIHRLAGDLAGATTGPGAGWVWTYSIGQHAARLAVLFALAAMMDLTAPFAVLLAFAPLALLIAMIPISIGMWGLREAAFVVLLGVGGMTAADALALSIAFGVLRLAVGALGGIIYALAPAAAYAAESP